VTDFTAPHKRIADEKIAELAEAANLLHHPRLDEATGRP